MCKIEKHNGTKMTAKLGKSLFNVAKRVAFGYVDPIVLHPMWIKCERENLPRGQRRLARMLKSSWADRVFALSVYALYLNIRCKPEWDIASITGASKLRDPYPPSFYPYLRDVFIPWVRTLLPIVPRIPKDLFLVKTGAWSTPGILAAGRDAYVLFEQFGKGKP